MDESACSGGGGSLSYTVTQLLNGTQSLKQICAHTILDFIFHAGLTGKVASESRDSEKYLNHFFSCPCKCPYETGPNNGCFQFMRSLFFVSSLTTEWFNVIETAPRLFLLVFSFLGLFVAVSVNPKRLSKRSLLEDQMKQSAPEFRCVHVYCPHYLM